MDHSFIFLPTTNIPVEKNLHCEGFFISDQADSGNNSEK